MGRRRRGNGVEFTGWLLWGGRLGGRGEERGRRRKEVFSVAEVDGCRTRKS